MAERINIGQLTNAELEELWSRLGLRKVLDAMRADYRVIASRAGTVAALPRATQRALAGPTARAPRRTPAQMAEFRQRVRNTKALTLDMFQLLMEDPLPLEDLKDTVERKVKKVSRGTIQAANREAMVAAFDNEGVRRVFWVSLADGNTCQDCDYLHGATMTIVDFRARYQRTRCGDRCRCRPRPIRTSEEVYQGINPLVNIGGLE